MDIIEELKNNAKKAADKAYSVYSNFPVGAALATREHHFFSGCNVENKSFGLTNCAERTAIFKAVSEGYPTIDTIVIYTPTETPTPPCGACRQVISEFGPDARVISICDSDQVIDANIRDLLPSDDFPVDLKK